jgi:transcriptional regulator with XRE-family HTH domain
MTVGERIKEARMRLGLSQVDFAEKINVSKQTLYKYENNIITNIPSDKIEAAATLSGVSPAYLMGWKDNSTETNQTASPFTQCQTKDEESLVLSYRELNDINKKKSVTYTKNLLSTQRMENELLAAHERTDIEVTPEGIQNDLDIMNDDSLWK